MEDDKIPEFLQNYFLATVSKGVNHPTIINFYDLSKLSDSLGSLPPLQFDNVDTSEEYSALLEMEEASDDFFTSDLIKKYHLKAKNFEVNVVPLSGASQEQISKVCEHIDSMRRKLGKMVQLPELSSAQQLERDTLSKQIQQEQGEVMNLLSGKEIETGSRYTGIDLKTGDFDYEERKEEYIDLELLSSFNNIEKFLNMNTSHLLIIVKSKLNPNIKFFTVRNWDEVQKGISPTESHDTGMKVPNSQSPRFIVKVTLYLQALCEEKDLQTQAHMEMLGCDPYIYGLVNGLDTDCFFNSTQAHLHSFKVEEQNNSNKENPGSNLQFNLLVHVEAS